MSLKAKLEAVIYAAEEPVTLNQLAMLFAEEALEWRAEQQKAAAELAAAAPAAPSQPLLTETFDYLELEVTADAPAEAPTPAEASAEAEPAAAAEPQSAPEPEAEAPTDPSVASEPAPEAAEPQTPEPTSAAQESTLEPSLESSPDPTPTITPEEEARQAARQRDREVRLIIRELLDELVSDYATDRSGVEIREIAGGFRMGTKPEYHDAVRAFVKSLKPAMKLSLPALETLAVIAYKQPVTAPEVNEIRGVESSGVFGSLLARKLIATAGRKPVVGRPILYKTTKEFLLRFGLKELNELPSMEEFEKMAASEFEETEAAAAALDDQTTEQNELTEPEPSAEPAPSADRETSLENQAPGAAPSAEPAGQSAPETTAEPASPEPAIQAEETTLE